MNVSLTPELERFVAETVSTGRYSTASEVVRASLRILEEQEHWTTYAVSRVARGLADMDAGRVLGGPAAMKRIRSAAKAKAPAGVPR